MILAKFRIGFKRQTAHTDGIAYEIRKYSSSSGFGCNPEVRSTFVALGQYQPAWIP